MLGNEIRKIVLEQSRRANVGHIGSALSVADMIAALYSGPLNLADRTSERDRFVLSKGHAALALYAALNLRGLLSDSELNAFCTDGTPIGVHPESAHPAIDFSTGSLGHGLSLGVGSALAARMERATRRTFVLMSDAECNEGSVWEAALFAGHHRLSNLTALIDANGQQALGYTRDVLDTEPLADKWASFGWDAVVVDGHSFPALSAALTEGRDARPRVLICKTVFGKGVTFMERQIRWHYLPMSDFDYTTATKEVG